MSSEVTGSISNSDRNTVPAPDRELFDHVARNLYTAVLSDSLDELGFRNQAMREFVRPLSRESVAVGWARTILCMDVHHTAEDPYATEIAAIDSILPGEVVVVATGRSTRNAPWGELLSTAAVARGARGCVTDGLTRDTRKILEMAFPVFSAGIKPVDSKGRGLVTNCNVPVECAGVVVNPGDLVVGDIDGVVVVPKAVVADAVRLATDKVTRENHSRKALIEGAYLRDVYDTYGVL